MPGKTLHGISYSVLQYYTVFYLQLPNDCICIYLYTKLISSNTSNIVENHARLIPHSSASQIDIKQSTPRMVCHVMSYLVTCFQLKERKLPLRDSPSTVQKTSKNSQVPHASRFHISSVIAYDSSDSPTFHCQNFGIQLMIPPCGFWTAQQLLPLFACGFPQCSTEFVWGHKNSQTVWIRHEGRNPFQTTRLFIITLCNNASDFTS